MRHPVTIFHRRVSFVWTLFAILLAFLVGGHVASPLAGPLLAMGLSVSVWGVLMVGVLLGGVYLWSARSATETRGMGAERTLPAVHARLQALLAALPNRTVLEMVLGPSVGLLVWWLPLGLEPVAHRAVAIVGLMLVYWMTEVLDHGLTALLGCLLFWLLHVAPPAVAFSGFTTPTPWFMLGWDAAGYSAAAYSQAYQQLYHTYLQAFHHTPLVAVVSRFGQESKAGLNGGPEGQALRARLDFAGRHGVHFLVPEIYTRQAAKNIYVKDEMLLPALCQYAGRSHLLVKLDPGEQRGRPVGEQTLQGVQALWPEVPVRAGLLAR